jgi:hypothetical protein
MCKNKPTLMSIKNIILLAFVIFAALYLYSYSNLPLTPLNLFCIGGIIIGFFIFSFAAKGEYERVSNFAGILFYSLCILYATLPLFYKHVLDISMVAFVSCAGGILALDIIHKYFGRKKIFEAFSLVSTWGVGA